MSPVQWICREWVKELGPHELDNGIELYGDQTQTKDADINELSVRGG